jgi:hypothetical protein
MNVFISGDKKTAIFRKQKPNLGRSFNTESILSAEHQHGALAGRNGQTGLLPGIKPAHHIEDAVESRAL